MGATIKGMLKKNQHKLNIKSELWEKPLGEQCNLCQVKLRQEQCISICKCTLFCHEDCFVKQISPYLTIKSHVTCDRCDQEVKFLMNATVLWVCNRRPAYIFQICFSILMSFITYLVIADGTYRSYASDGFCYSILGLIVLILLYAILKNSRLKVVKVDDVRVVNTKVLQKQQTHKGILSIDMDDSIKAKSKQKLSNTVSRVELQEYQVI